MVGASHRLSGLAIATLLCLAVALVATVAPAAAVTFTNAGPITMPDPNCTDPDAAGPYPSNIVVSGMTGTVSDVNVTLNNITHAFEGDIEVMLVGPGGGSQNLKVLSDAGTGALTNGTVTFDDAAAGVAPQNTAWAPGTYKPTNYTELPPNTVDVFPAPAPAPSATTTLATAFNGINPNGTWSLYVTDDACPDAGSIGGGWTLNITATAGAVTSTAVTSSLNPSRTGQSVTFTSTVTSSGSPVTAGTVTFTEGATTLAAGVPVNASGVATFTTSALPEGNHIVTATYNGTASFATSNGSVDQRVDNNTTATGSTHCNTGPVAIPNIGTATPYPSNIFVAGGPTTLGKVTVTLKNVTHSFDGDIDALLVGPAGQNLVMLSDAGTAAVSNVTVTFDDAAAAQLPVAGGWAAAGSTITAKPTNYVELMPDSFPAPAPSPSASTALTTFAGTNTNGTWRLYLNDDGAPDTGSIAGGWCVTLQAAPTIATTASPNVTIGAGTLTDTAVVSGRTSPQAGATITFTLFGPGDTTCSGTPVFAPAPVPYPVAGGPVTSPAFTPTTAGTYRWRAAYSGDVNNAAVAGACNAANENVVVSQATPSIATTASPDIGIGAGTLTDTAVVSGRINPQSGATITFTLFGPGDATCTGTPVFAPAPVSYPVAGGPVTSPAFTPTQAGTYRWRAAYSGDVNNAAVSGPCNAANESTVVNRATPTIATTSSPQVTLGGATATDTATVSGRVNPQAGATITFTLYGPGDTTCTGSAVFAPAPVAYPVAGGPVTSPAFTPTNAGTYRWIAAYSGDVNNAPVTGACNDANEVTVVSPSTPSITTTASPGITLGAGSLTDTAVVSGRVNPQAGATVTFTLYGPGDATCSGTPVFPPAAVAYPLAGGPLTSPAFTPTQAGTYRWRAAYSGDVNNAAVAGACNAANETVVVNKATPSIATTASPSIALGAGTLTDVAVVSGRVNPQAGATITFTLYGPGDVTCSAAPVFAPAPVSYPVAGGPVTSPAFTPTALGTHRWIASYSGDANNAPVTGACNDADENVQVALTVPMIATTASAQITVGSGQLTDTAVVSGRNVPLAGATIDFRLYGPDDATCSGTPVFAPAAVAYPVAGGPVTSPAFTPTTAGTYRWRATYSGDANNASVAGACNAANENVVVNRAAPTIATTASTQILIGGQVTDAATVSGRVNPQPGATIDFRLYGPADTTCSGTPVFESPNVPYPVAGGPVTSAPFTPAVAGIYRWRATYSGDVNNAPTTGACDDPAELVAVLPVPPPPAPPPPPPPPAPVPTCQGKTATIVPAAGQTVVTGTQGNDVIVGRDARETIDGRGGNDVICAGGGNDKVRGRSGNDRILGEAGKDRLFGDGGRDQLQGGLGIDVLRGGKGNDRTGGGGGRDRVYGDAGNDLLDEQKLGGVGRDRLYGGTGKDRIRARGGNSDRVDCGPGRDSALLDVTDIEKRCERVRRRQGA